MPPYFMELCTHALWAYAPMLYGLMHPYFMGLCVHALWAYAPILYGLMHPYFMGLCTHTLWAYASILYGAMRPYFRELHPPRSCGFPHTDKVRIDTVLLHEFGMSSVLYDISLIHDKYLIGVFDS